ncbi:zinc finger protein ZFP2-like [Condylostylus longicornis]|uniref:zinc finger protein ZFP2-like n=1 Tax=Condylostylus longicornis TaxID=2530218 RepID=UPI00244E3758|nr:zinc finger protein ZFP2-like [Condylostylus longicornis]
MELMKIEENIYQKCGEIFLSDKTNYTFLCFFCNELLYEFNEFKTHSLLHSDEVESNSVELELSPNNPKLKQEVSIDAEDYNEMENDFLNSEAENDEGVIGESVDNEKKILEANILNGETQENKTIQIDEDENIFDKSNIVASCSYCTAPVKDLHTLEECSVVKEIIEKNKGDFISLLRLGILCCCECHLCFDTYKKLYEHHKDEKHCSENNLCKICKFHAFMDSKMKICKENRKKIKQKMGTEINSQNYNNEPTTKRDFRFKCSYCERIFRTNCQLQYHIKIHTNDRPYKCENCPAAFTMASYLKAHNINKHTEDRPFSCEFENCDAKFKTFHFMKQHEKTHGKGSFQCEMCGNYYKTKFYLKRHQRSAHVDPEFWPHQCELCNKRFAQSEYLVEHIRIHTGEKPFGCNMCPKFFRKRTSLREHKKLHSEERKHVCNICGKGFKQTAGYWGHMKRHPIIS